MMNQLACAKAARERGDMKRAHDAAHQAFLIAESTMDRRHAATLRFQYLVDDNDFEGAPQVVRDYLMIDPDIPLSPGLRTLIAISDYKLEKTHAADAWDLYWRQRQNYVYMHVCKQLIGMIARSATVVADIGSNRTPLLDFFPQGIKKYSVDPHTPYEGRDVEAVFADFHCWDPDEPIQFGTCMQTMEHVPDAKAFASRMLDLCEVSLISVPYLEVAGYNPGHIHSMISVETITDWFGRLPNYHYVATEFSGEQRIICIFDRTDEKIYPAFNRESMTAMRYRYRWSLRGSSLDRAA